MGYLDINALGKLGGITSSWGAKKPTAMPPGDSVSQNFFSSNLVGVNTNIGIGDTQYGPSQAGYDRPIMRTLGFG